MRASDQLALPYERVTPWLKQRSGFEEEKESEAVGGFYRERGRRRKERKELGVASPYAALEEGAKVPN